MTNTRVYQSLTLTGLLILVSCLAIFSGQISESDQLDIQNNSNTSPNSPGFQSGSIFTHDSIAAGSEHSMLLKSDGTVWGAGNNKFGQLGDGTKTNRNTFVQAKDSSGSMLPGQ